VWERIMYDKTKAEQFWTRRVSEVDELRAVLSYNVPDYINETYSRWELGLLAKSLDDISGKSILDMGCGVGRITIELLRGGANVTALDNSRKMLEITEAKAKTASLEKNLQLVKSSAHEIPLPDETFDIVVCVGLLEHLPLDVRSRALKELDRVLKRGGNAYIIVNNENSLFLKRNRSYQMNAQREDGYFVGIIGLGFIREFFTSLGAKAEILGSNFFYSYFRHTLDQLGEVERLDLISKEMMKLTLRIDLEGESWRSVDLENHLADQFLVRVSK
jgi:ubiquinone/menaquinone biosynthesis C-methylase UbiE